MPRIDPTALRLAMDRSGMTVTQLADSQHTSLSYMSDICSGRRNLARSPGLRKGIAQALKVPQHWIEVQP